ncbi:MAG: PEGA domain-containing protein [Candidatus Micrarchaeota archaeon]
MDNRGLIIFGIVLVGIFAVLFYTSTGQDSSGQAIKALTQTTTDSVADDVQSAPKVSSGTLKAYSNPSGANIYLNEVYKGITPKTFSVAAGTYTLKLTKAGYLPYVQSITIIKGRTLTVNANLILNVTPSPSPSPSIIPSPTPQPNGTLSITTNPSGALIQLRISGTNFYSSYGLTPKNIVLPANQYDVFLQKTGYNYYYGTSTVYPGQTEYLIVNMTPVPSPSPNATITPTPTATPTPIPANGTLYAYSSPTGAGVYIDKAGNPWPYPFFGYTYYQTHLAPGNYFLEFRKDGYTPYFTAFTVYSGQSTYVSANLTISNQSNFSSSPKVAEFNW